MSSFLSASIIHTGGSLTFFPLRQNWLSPIMNQWLANCNQLHPEFPLGRQGTSNELAITYSAAVLAGPLTSATQRRWLAFFPFRFGRCDKQKCSSHSFWREDAHPGRRLQPSVNLHLPVALLCNLTHFPPFVVVWVPDEPSTLLLSVKHGCAAAHPEKISISCCGDKWK